jgi:hypothetical protein
MAAPDEFESYLRMRSRYFSLTIGAAAAVMSAVLSVRIPYYHYPLSGIIAVIFGALFGVLCIWSMLTWFQILRWPCPRCGKSFVFACWSTWPTNQCKHCGLSVHRAD